MPAKKKVVKRRPARLDSTALKAREAAIIADLKAGHLSYRKIAAKNRVSLPTVNAKARKAGISRPKGRRPAVVGKVKVTKAPIAAVAARSGRARKAVAAPVTMSAKRKKVRRTRRVAAAAKPTTRATHFADAFRQMVLHYFPSLTLAKFERLSKIISKEIS